MAKRGNGEGSIYQRRSDGRWVGSISLGNGKRKPIYGKTRQDVAKKLTTALKVRQDGLPIVGERQTVSSFLSTWLDTVESAVRVRTFEAYDLNVRRVLPYVGHIRLARLGPEHVQSCYNELLKLGLSRRSVEQAHAVIHAALRQAMKWGLIHRNPTDAVNVPRPVRKEMKVLTTEQVKHLFEATSEDREHALWVVLVTTGLRIGEALGLKWDDIDLEAGQLAVRRALQRQRGGKIEFVEPKTAKSRRVVHLRPGTITALSDHRRCQLEDRLALGSAWHDRDLVFCREDGRVYDPASMTRRLRKALARAGLPRVRVHDLRHTCATHLLTKGEHPRVVQDLLGHSTVSLTLDTYSHVSPALHRQATQHMDDFFEPIETPVAVKVAVNQGTTESGGERTQSHNGASIRSLGQS